MKKKKNNKPRRWKFRREQRLQSAKSWIKEYNGKDIIAGYSKHFKCDKLSAAIELRMIGKNIDEKKIEKLKFSGLNKAHQNRIKKLNKLEKQIEEMKIEEDDDFCYIVGYAFGKPYGTTWDEINKEPPWVELELEAEKIRNLIENQRNVSLPDNASDYIILRM